MAEFDYYGDWQKKRADSLAEQKKREFDKQFGARRGEIDAVTATPYSAQQIYHWTRGAGSTDDPMKRRFEGYLKDLMPDRFNIQNPFAGRNIGRQGGNALRGDQGYYFENTKDGQRRLSAEEAKQYEDYQKQLQGAGQYTEADIQAAIDARNQSARTAKEQEIRNQIQSQIDSQQFSPILEGRLMYDEFAKNAPLDKASDVKQIEDQARSEMEEAMEKIRRQNAKRGISGTLKERRQLQRVKEEFQTAVDRKKLEVEESFKQASIERGTARDRIEQAGDEQAMAEAIQNLNNLAAVEQQRDQFQNDRLTALQQLGSGLGSLAGLYVGKRYGNDPAPVKPADPNFALNPYAFMGSIGGQSQPQPLQRYPYQGLLSRGG